MESKKRDGWWALAAVIAVSVVLVLSGYVWAYYAMVTPYGSLPTVGLAGVTWGPQHASYPYEWMGSLFEPIHQIDRAWIRPKFWNSPTNP